MRAPRRARLNGFIAMDDASDAVYYDYLRVSTDDQEKDGMSLPTQGDETLAYGDRHPDWTYGGRYQDVESGTRRERGDYQRLLARVRADRASGRAVRTVIAKQSRLGRDIEELARVWKDLVVALGVQIHSTRDGGHINDIQRFLFAGLMDHLFIETLRENVGASLDRFARLGWAKPGPARWGYQFVAASAEQRLQGSPKVVLVPHPKEHAYVRELFRRRAEGWSYQRLTDWAQGLPAEARGERRLTLSGIRNALGCRTYLARCSGPERDPLDTPVGRWEPLCDDATWRVIRGSDAVRENDVPVALRSEYALTHYLFCACGSRMCGFVRGGHVRRRPGRQPYVEPLKRGYLCASRMEGADARAARSEKCHRTIQADLIEELVFRIIGTRLSVLATPDIARAARAESRELEQQAQARGPERRLAHRREQRTKLVEQRARLTISRSEGEISREEYAEAKAVLTDDIERMSAEIADLEPLVGQTSRAVSERAAIDVLLDQATFWEQVAREGTTDDRRELLRLLVERVRPERIRPGEYRAGISFTRLGEHLLQVTSGLLLAAGRVEAVQWSRLHYSLSTGPDDAAADPSSPPASTIQSGVSRPLGGRSARAS